MTGRELLHAFCIAFIIMIITINSSLTRCFIGGKGGKGLGKGGAKRHRKILRDNIQGKPTCISGAGE